MVLLQALQKLIHDVDVWLLLTWSLIITLGLIMVTSSSFDMSQKLYGYPWFFLSKQVLHLIIGMTGALVLCQVPLAWWQRHSIQVLLLAMLMLVLVLVPGLGREVNGSMRWLNLGIIRVQVSELMKLALVLYLAHYVVAFNASLRQSVMGVCRLLALLSLILLLLLSQPDFGASVVLMLTTLGVLFLAGVRFRVFITLMLVAVFLFACLALTSPYRLARLTAFLNPWANQFDSGYQLTQSLIAFGRAGWLGLGLGQGIQKLFYLPEAHTDFIFAILTEELGLIGAIVLLLLFMLCVMRAFLVGYRAHQLQKHYNGFLAQGFALLLAIQVLISVGVNTGILPTKGLTLPFVSYGGSSLVVFCWGMGFLFRVHFENQWHDACTYRRKAG